MKVNSFLKPWLILVLCLPQLLGCSSGLPAGTRKPITQSNFPSGDVSAVVEREVISVPMDAVEPPPKDYVVGPGDVLYVNIFGKAELSTVHLGDKLSGARVDGNGHVQLPVIGTVPVGGSTLPQIREKIQNAAKNYISDPWVIVEVTEFRSQPIYLLGQFNRPGVYYMDRPYTLLQGIALGEGLNATASIRGARLLRNKKIMSVDVHDLLREGAVEHNIWLQPGDTLYVPDEKHQKVFVLGAVKTPGAVSMAHGPVTLPQAIAMAGGFEDTGYDHENIRVIRSLSTTRGELIVVDMRKMLRGDTLPFPLMEGDIVFVPRSAFGDWNKVVNEILPSLELIGATLNPFVQIKFLSDDD